MPADLTDLERRALDAVDPTELVATLRTLIALPSIGGSPAEAEIQHVLARRLDALGADVDLWPIDLAAMRRTPGYPGEEVDRREAWGLVGTSTGAAGSGATSGPPALVLQGHVDVVPPGDLTAWPTGDPWDARVTGDEVHGRGACDMKAGVAVNLGVLAALRQAGVRLARPLAVHCVVGEEDGGIGAFATLQRGHRGDACVITEPTDGNVITANGGALTFRITVPGAATHASTRYAGASALDAYWPIHRALADLERGRNVDPDPLMADYPIPYTISVGTVRTGDWPSSVPDLLVAEGRLGVVLGEPPDAARRALEQAVAGAGNGDPWLTAHPARVEWAGGQYASGRLPTGHPLTAAVQRAWTDANEAPPPQERGGPYGSDLRLYADAGVPTLQIGPGEVRLAHSPEERVRIGDLVRTCRALVLTAVRACAVG